MEAKLRQTVRALIEKVALYEERLAVPEDERTVVDLKELGMADLESDELSPLIMSPRDEVRASPRFASVIDYDPADVIPRMSTRKAPDRPVPQAPSPRPDGSPRPSGVVDSPKVSPRVRSNTAMSSPNSPKVSPRATTKTQTREARSSTVDATPPTIVVKDKSVSTSPRKPAYARATKENPVAEPTTPPPVPRGAPPPIPARTSGVTASQSCSPDKPAARNFLLSSAPATSTPVPARPPVAARLLVAEQDNMSDSLSGMSPPKTLPALNVSDSLPDSLLDDEAIPSVLPPTPSSKPRLKVRIKQTEMVSEGGVSLKKVQLFVMAVQNLVDDVVLDEWLVCRRYKAFHSLWQELQSQTSKTLHFPAKKFKLTLDDSESEERGRLLQKFLDEILTLPHLAGSTPFTRFIDPLEKPSMFGLLLLDIRVQSTLWIWQELPFNQHEWQQRHVVLVSGKVFWFKGSNSVDCVGHIAVDYCSCDVRDETETIEGKPNFVFEVKHLLQPKPQLFASPSAMERINWVKAIRQARAVISGGTIGASANQYATGDERPIVAADKPGSGEQQQQVMMMTKSSTMLKGYAAGQLRLSTFTNVPDTLSSMQGSFSFCDGSDSPDQIVFKKDASVSDSSSSLSTPLLSRMTTTTMTTVMQPGKAIQGATFRKLVEKMTTAEYFAPTFVAHFLLTYRISSTPQEVLSLLLARYHHSGLQSTSTRGNRNAVLARNPTQDRVCQVLEIWIDTCYWEFADDPDLTQRLLAFVFRDLEGNILMHEHALKLKSAIKIKVDEGGLAPIEPKGAPAPLLPKMVTGALDILDIDPLEVARQMTLLDHEVFSRIQPLELLGQKWTKHRHEAPNVLAMIGRFNSTAAWVTRMILSFPEPPLRGAVFSQLLRIAHHLSTFRSWGSLCAIMGGLVSPPVSRLKRTLACVAEADLQLMQELERIIDPGKNHVHYRKLLEACQPPCVPYLGLYLADLTFIEDGNPSYLAGNEEDAPAERLINWEKRRMLGKVLAEVRKFQSLRYAFHAIPALQFFLTQESAPLPDKEAYDLSLKLEPREAISK